MQAWPGLDHGLRLYGAFVKSKRNRLVFHRGDDYLNKNDQELACFYTG